MPCPECGASVARPEKDEHVCAQERWLDYQIFQLREEIAGFERDLGAYLDSSQGRFGLWCAQRERTQRASE